LIGMASVGGPHLDVGPITAGNLADGSISVAFQALDVDDNLVGDPIPYSEGLELATETYYLITVAANGMKGIMLNTDADGAILEEDQVTTQPGTISGCIANKGITHILSASPTRVTPEYYGYVWYEGDVETPVDLGLTVVKNMNVQGSEYYYGPLSLTFADAVAPDLGGDGGSGTTTTDTEAPTWSPTFAPTMETMESPTAGEGMTPPPSAFPSDMPSFMPSTGPAASGDTLMPSPSSGTPGAGTPEAVNVDPNLVAAASVMSTSTIAMLLTLLLGAVVIL